MNIEDGSSDLQTLGDDGRTLSLLSATAVGVGAIVGGGILALAGVAFANAGKAAVVAFAINGVVALLTACSLAEMAVRFPVSGGIYALSRRVLAIEAAFLVGWVVWFASIVAAVLYAIGFGYFLSLFFAELDRVFPGSPLASFAGRRAEIVYAATATFVLAAWLTIRGGGGGLWANAIKVLVFGTLIGGAFFAWLREPSVAAAQTVAAEPFFHGGVAGLASAMGFSFIALQGFDLIAAVAGQVRQPSRNLPRAMIGSLLIALAIYLPLLWLIPQVGLSPGESLAAVAASDPEGIVATAAKRFLGVPGYWLVVVAAVLSMGTALQANLFAASSIAASMARDRTLPARLATTTRTSDQPYLAMALTAMAIVILIVVLPSVAVAGAASSLIFLLAFAASHALAILMRVRGGQLPGRFSTPWFPLVPALGLVACLSLAMFQGWSVPAAGMVAVVWMMIGAAFFASTLSRRARTVDAATMAVDPELARLRGLTPVMLVPIANPANAPAMLQLAGRLVPAGVGRVMVQTVVRATEDWKPWREDDEATRHSIAVMRSVLAASQVSGVRCETLTTISSSPLPEIARVARVHACESVLIGFQEIGSESDRHPLEDLLSELSCDVVVMKTPDGFRWDEVNRLLIPTAGRGGHDHLLARLIGGLGHDSDREVHLLRVMAESSTEAARFESKRRLMRMAGDHLDRPGRWEIAVGEPEEEILHRCDAQTLLVLGAQRIGRRQKLLGPMARRLAQRTPGPVVILSRRG